MNTNPIVTMYISIKRGEVHGKPSVTIARQRNTPLMESDDVIAVDTRRTIDGERYMITGFRYIKSRYNNRLTEMNSCDVLKLLMEYGDWETSLPPTPEPKDRIWTHKVGAYGREFKIAKEFPHDWFELVNPYKTPAYLTDTEPDGSLGPCNLYWLNDVERISYERTSAVGSRFATGVIDTVHEPLYLIINKNGDHDIIDSDYVPHHYKKGLWKLCYSKHKPT